MGVTFNRQRPVLNYIADFLCKDLKLIIEVDGYSHTLEKVIIKDQKRQSVLESAGFRFLRFCDDEILHSMSSVREAIFQTIEEIKSNQVADLK